MNIKFVQVCTLDARLREVGSVHKLPDDLAKIAVGKGLALPLTEAEQQSFKDKLLAEAKARFDIAAAKAAQARQGFTQEASGLSFRIRDLEKAIIAVDAELAAARNVFETEKSGIISENAS